MEYYNRNRLCGCWIPFRPNPHSYVERRYLPQVDLASTTTILATTSRTTLKQTFINDQDQKLDEVQYTFPLYDGVSVVGFTCTVGEKIIVGVVKEKQQARVEYQAAIARGETAGLLEQLPEASDVFTTSVGNVPPKEKIHIEIVYLGELKHDAETDGSRFTLPTIIAPRYGAVSDESASTLATSVHDKGGISISVDVTLENGTIVRGLQSPSHPIAVTMGRTSEMDEDAFRNNHASATLTLGSTELDKDFIIVVLAKGTDTPRALLETHPIIPNQRAIMTTLVPKFNIPNISPEIVFVIDRSGSMGGKIELVVSAMKIFLKSLPIGIKFNICSFGSRHSFLFKKSKTYDQSSLKEALSHLDTFSANYGGTEMLQPVKATIKNRYNDLSLEVMLLTDGEIWNQEELFTVVNQTPNARFFTLGIGHGASSALVEGIARAGNGFAQFVGENEKMDKRVVRMLKGALTPHITDYTLEVTYHNEDPPPEYDDFEMIDSAPVETARPVVTDLKKPDLKKTISLFDTTAVEEPPNPPTAGRYDNLPDVSIQKVLQAPHKVPALYPFNRTTVYLLLGPDAPQKTPKSVTLRGTSQHGPLELEIPVQDIGLGETMHQLAAKKAVHELEQGRGWITEVRVGNKPLKTVHEGKWDLIVEREAVRLGVLFQVGGKWCSFVAVEKGSQQEHEATSPPARDQELGRPRRSGESNPSLFSSSLSNLSFFGSPSYAGGASLFGAASSLPFPTPQTSGLFGSASTGAAAKPSANGALFGSATVQAQPDLLFASDGSGFGGLDASNRPSTGGGLFGGSSSSSNFSSAPASRPGGLFGGTPSTTSIFAGGGGLFGSAAPPASSPAKADATSPLPEMALNASASTPPSSFYITPAADNLADSSSVGAMPSPSGGRGGQYVAFAARAPDSVSQQSFGAGQPQAQAQYRVAQSHSLPTGAIQQRQQMHMQHAQQMQQAQMAAPMASQAPPAAAPAPSNDLADYQMGLMTLHQDNKSRKRMMSAAKPGSNNPFAQPPPPPPMMRMSASQISPLSAAAPGAMDAKRTKKKSLGGFSFRRKSQALADEDAEAEEDGAGDAMEVEISTLSNADKMHKIIDLQEFDGSWQLSDKLLELIGLSDDQFTSLNLTGNSNNTHKATSLAIAWLKAKVPAEEDVWEMVVEKAMGWLATEVGGEASAEESVKAARKAF